MRHQNAASKSLMETTTLRVNKRTEAPARRSNWQFWTSTLDIVTYFFPCSDDLKAWGYKSRIDWVRKAPRRNWGFVQNTYTVSSIRSQARKSELNKHYIDRKIIMDLIERASPSGHHPICSFKRKAVHPSSPLSTQSWTQWQSRICKPYWSWPNIPSRSEEPQFFSHWTWTVDFGKYIFLRTITTLMAVHRITAHITLWAHHHRLKIP